MSESGRITLQPGEFSLVLPNASPEPGGDGDGGSGIEVEIDSELDTDELFDSSIESEIAPALGTSEAVGESINNHVGLYRSSVTNVDGPYSVHPDVMAGDEVREYDETNVVFRNEYHKRSREVSATSRTLAVRLRRVLLARSLSRLERDHVRGELDRNKLARLNLPGQLPDRRVFCKLRHGESNRVVVGVVIDQSYSMKENRKIEYAKSAAIAIGDALSQLVGVGVEFGMWGFNTFGCPHYHRVHAEGKKNGVRYDRMDHIALHAYKEPGERWQKVAARTGAMKPDRSNADGESLRWVARRLLSVGADRRIMIVLSDGLPVTASMWSSADRFERDLRCALAEISDLGIEPLGVGILDTHPRRYYPTAIIINKVSELQSKLLSGLAELFKVKPTGRE